MTGWLCIELLSAATFSAGEGVAAEVNTDVEQEATGLPLIGGRRLKGLLSETCAELLAGFDGPAWRTAAERLFGRTRANGSASILVLDDARLPEPVREAARKAVEENGIHPLQVLATLSEVRRQTRVDRVSGAPAGTSLRGSRVVLPGLRFYAPVEWLEEPTEHDRALLAACALGTRRGGLLRNRGRGRIRCSCLDEDDDDVTAAWAAMLLHEA